MIDCGEAGDDYHSKLLFFVTNKGQWNEKSGPNVADGNVDMQTKISGRLESKLERLGRNCLHFAHTLTDTHTTAAKLVVRITSLVCILSRGSLRT